MTRLPRTLLLSLSLLLFAFAAAEPAAAGKRFHHGVGVSSFPSQAQFHQARGGGAKIMRGVFYWGSVEPSPGARNWNGLDAVVTRAARSGVRLLPVLYGVPPWLVGGSGSGPAQRVPPMFSNYARLRWGLFVRDLANRYGRGGTFWAAHPQLAYSPIRQWQLWNEVNLEAFWGSRPKPGVYAKLVKLTHRFLRAGDRKAKVVLAGLIPYKTRGRGNMSGDRYLRKLLKRKWVRKRFNIAAVHPYGRSPKLVMKGIRRIRKALNESGARKRKIWATEFGWSVGGAGWGSSPVKASSTAQAKRLKKSFKRMRKGRKRYGLKAAFYFSFQDFNPPGVDYWSSRMGLFDLSGRARPAWFAFAHAAGGVP